MDNDFDSLQNAIWKINFHFGKWNLVLHFYYRTKRNQGVIELSEKNFLFPKTTTNFFDLLESNIF